MRLLVSARGVFELEVFGAEEVKERVGEGLLSEELARVVSRNLAWLFLLGQP